MAAFALVFAGGGAIVSDARSQGALGAVGVSLTFGLIILVMVYATRHLSGAHINPAVTIAFTLGRHFPARDALAYIAAQLLGATVGALVLLAAWPDQPAQLGAIAIGGAVALDALFGGPVTGASMNPARSFGPALASGEWGDFWSYVAGPVAGAAMGVFGYELVRGSERI
jgi:glycerol uptake facilitator-like aquaporin